MKIEVENLPEVLRDVDSLSRNVGRGTNRALDEAARVVESEAKLRCPKGPTKAQAKTDKKYGYSPKKSPGTLQNSIDVVKGRDWRDIGVFQGAATKYAAFINFGEGTLWKNLGPGSKAKQAGRKVGGLFIERAYSENKRDIDAIFDKGVSVAVEKFNRS